MKRITLSFLSLLILVSVPMINPGKAEAQIKVPLSFSYDSTYWWRGIELNGRNVGVMWLGAGVELGDTGLTLQFYSALSQDYLIQSDDSTADYRTYKKNQKTLTEFDYGLVYAKDIGDMVSIESALFFIQYAFYDEIDSQAKDPSMIELSLAIDVKTILNPTLTLYYDYYIEESEEKTPVNEDYYIHFAVSQALMEAQGFSFTVGGWVGYYNNAYVDVSGWSDAGLTTAFEYESGPAKFEAAFNYARSLTSDFQLEYTKDDYPQQSIGILKNHTWVSFGVTYTL